MKRLPALLVLVIGCGSAADDVADAIDPRPDPLLIGNWIAPIGDSCATGANFDGRRYSLNSICVVGSSLQLESEQGTYSTTDGKVNLATELASCRDARPGFLRYTVTPATLSLAGANAAVIYMRNTAAGGSAAATFGCFKGGVFTPSQLAPI